MVVLIGSECIMQACAGHMGFLNEVLLADSGDESCPRYMMGFLWR